MAILYNHMSNIGGPSFLWDLMITLWFFRLQKTIERSTMHFYWEFSHYFNGHGNYVAFYMFTRPGNVIPGLPMTWRNFRNQKF